MSVKLKHQEPVVLLAGSSLLCLALNSENCFHFLRVMVMVPIQATSNIFFTFLKTSFS